MAATEQIAEELLLPIGNEWIRTDTMDTIRLPFDGSPVTKVSQGDPALVNRAVQAAREAAPMIAGWSNFERAELLDRIAGLIRRDHAAFALLISQETGKPIAEARVEVDRACTRCWPPPLRHASCMAKPCRSTQLRSARGGWR